MNKFKGFFIKLKNAVKACFIRLKNAVKVCFIKLKDDAVLKARKFLFTRNNNKLRAFKLRAELYADYIGFLTARLEKQTADKVEEFAIKQENAAAPAALIENYGEFKAAKTAEFKAKREKKDNLAYRAFREKSRRGGTLTDEGLTNYRNALNAAADTAAEQYAKGLDEKFNKFKGRPLADARPLAEIRGQNEKAVAKYKEQIYSALALKKEKARAENAKRIAACEKKIAECEAKRSRYRKYFKSNDELPDDTVLRAENLCMYFGGLKAVDGLNFDIKRGEIFGLIGPNGAGKTTVFNCVTQFYKSTKGDIWYRAESGDVVLLGDYKVHDVSTLGMARTFQNIEVIREISVIDNLLVAAHRTFTTGLLAHVLHSPLLRREELTIRERALKVLDFLGIARYAYLPAFGLPYGILKKIEIARTLMLKPKFIILDEPAAGLNDTETAALGELIKKIAEEYDCTVFLVEHDMGLVMEICDRILAIAFGKPLAIGTPAEIQADAGVRAAYLGEDA